MDASQADHSDSDDSADTVLVSGSRRARWAARARPAPASRCAKVDTWLNMADENGNQMSSPPAQRGFTDLFAAAAGLPSAGSCTSPASPGSHGSHSSHRKADRQKRKRNVTESRDYAESDTKRVKVEGAKMARDVPATERQVQSYAVDSESDRRSSSREREYMVAQKHRVQSNERATLNDESPSSGGQVSSVRTRRDTPKETRRHSAVSAVGERGGRGSRPDGQRVHSPGTSGGASRCDSIVPPHSAPSCSEMNYNSSIRSTSAASHSLKPKDNRHVSRQSSGESSSSRSANASSHKGGSRDRSTSKDDKGSGKISRKSADQLSARNAKQSEVLEPMPSVSKRPHRDGSEAMGREESSKTVAPAKKCSSEKTSSKCNNKSPRRKEVERSSASEVLAEQTVAPVVRKYSPNYSHDKKSGPHGSKSSQRVDSNDKGPPRREKHKRSKKTNEATSTRKKSSKSAVHSPKRDKLRSRKAREKEIPVVRKSKSNEHPVRQEKLRNREDSFKDALAASESSVLEISTPSSGEEKLLNDAAFKPTNEDRIRGEVPLPQVPCTLDSAVDGVAEVESVPSQPAISNPAFHARPLSIQSDDESYGSLSDDPDFEEFLERLNRDINKGKFSGLTSVTSVPSAPGDQEGAVTPPVTVKQEPSDDRSGETSETMEWSGPAAPSVTSGPPAVPSAVGQGGQRRADGGDTTTERPAADDVAPAIPCDDRSALPARLIPSPVPTAVHRVHTTEQSTSTALFDSIRGACPSTVGTNDTRPEGGASPPPLSLDLGDGGAPCEPLDRTAAASPTRPWPTEPLCSTSDQSELVDRRGVRVPPSSDSGPSIGDEQPAPTGTTAGCPGGNWSSRPMGTPRGATLDAARERTPPKEAVSQTKTEVSGVVENCAPDGTNSQPPPTACVTAMEGSPPEPATLDQPVGAGPAGGPAGDATSQSVPLADRFAEIESLLADVWSASSCRSEFAAARSTLADLQETVRLAAAGPSASTAEFIETCAASVRGILVAACQVLKGPVRQPEESARRDSPSRQEADRSAPAVDISAERSLIAATNKSGQSVSSTDKYSKRTTSKDKLNMETSTDKSSKGTTSTEKPSKGSSTNKSIKGTTSSDKSSEGTTSTDKPNKWTSTDKPGKGTTSTGKSSEGTTSTDKPIKWTCRDKSDKEKTYTDKSSKWTKSTDKANKGTKFTDKPGKGKTATYKPSTETCTTKPSKATGTKNKPGEGATSTDKPNKETVSTDKPSRGTTSTDSFSKETSTDKLSKGTSTDKPSKGTGTKNKPGEGTTTYTDKPNKGTPFTDKLSKEATSSDKLRKRTASTDKFSKGTASTDNFSKETSSDKLSKGTTSTDKPGKGTSTVNTSKEITSTDKPSKGTTSADKLSKGTTSTEKASKEVTSTDKSDKGTTSSNKTSKDAASTDKLIKETSTNKLSKGTMSTYKTSKETSTGRPNKEATSTGRPNKETTSTDKPSKDTASTDKPSKGTTSVHQPSKGTSADKPEQTAASSDRHNQTSPADSLIPVTKFAERSDLVATTERRGEVVAAAGLPSSAAASDGPSVSPETARPGTDGVPAVGGAPPRPGAATGESGSPDPQLAAGAGSLRLARKPSFVRSGSESYPDLVLDSWGEPDGRAGSAQSASVSPEKRPCSPGGRAVTPPPRPGRCGDCGQSLPAMFGKVLLHHRAICRGRKERSAVGLERSADDLERSAEHLRSCSHCGARVARLISHKRHCKGYRMTNGGVCMNCGETVDCFSTHNPICRRRRSEWAARRRPHGPPSHQHAPITAGKACSNCQEFVCGPFWLHNQRCPARRSAGR